jgi:hypothetical protein
MDFIRSLELKLEKALWSGNMNPNPFPKYNGISNTQETKNSVQKNALISCIYFSSSFKGT